MDGRREFEEIRDGREIWDLYIYIYIYIYIYLLIVKLTYIPTQ